MPRILLANEFGAGRGHLVTLVRTGEACGDGFQFDAALCQRRYDSVLAPLRPSVFDGPCLGTSPDNAARRRGVAAATWGEFLGDLGFDKVARLRAIVAWWREVLVSRHIDLLIGEYAPLALLSARSLGIPAMACGQGYGLPPADMERFPELESPGTLRRLHDERQLLSNVNEVAAEVGLAPLSGLPEVYRADLTLVQTLPLLDPYRSWRNTRYLPPRPDMELSDLGAGDEVFVYFSTTELETPGVVEALEMLPLPRRGYLPAASEAVRQRLSASGMVVERSPVPEADIVRRSRLFLNAGQHGSLCLGLLSGVPQVCVPQQREQLFSARRAEGTGAAITVMKDRADPRCLVRHVLDAYGNTAMRQAALKVADEVRTESAAVGAHSLSHAIAPMRAALIGGAVGGPLAA